MSKSESNRQARAAAAEAMRKQRQAERRRTLLIQGGVGLVVLLVVAGVTVAALSQREQSEAAQAESGPTPTQVNDVGAYVLGEDGAPVTIEVVEDFQCPVCQNFEAISGDLLDGYVADGTAQVAYRSVAFLDRASSTQYSTRALNASACVMPDGDGVWSAFHRALFEQQPAEGGAGLDDDTLVSIAADSGADEERVASCVADGTYDGWTQRTTAAVSDDGYTSTPTIVVDGQQLPSYDPETIQAAVERASGA